MKISRIVNKSLAVILSLSMFWALASEATATEIQNIQNEINNLQDDVKKLEDQKQSAKDAMDAAKSQLSNVNGQISSISGAMGDLGAEIDEIDQELVGLLTDINLIEADIAQKKEQIIETQGLYDQAVETENEQYEAMKIRIKYMYEVGDMSYLSIFLESASLSDAINKADYIEQLYEYDRTMLIKYQEAVAYTKAVWDQLEEEKSELETSKIELEEEQAYLKEVMEQMEAEYDNYSVILAQAKKQAASYTSKINQQTNEIKKIEQAEKEKQAAIEKKKKEEEEARLKAEQEAAQAALESGDIEKASEIANNSTTSTNTTTENTETTSQSSSSSSTSTPTVSGSGKGSEIASYALQFVGNPYKAGGTSLTDGADCSGFVQSVYKHFGYSLPRTSYAQSTAGRAVSYSEAKPGDIIYYGGHVAIFIGNGQIVHASTEKTGIKVSSATYRSIVTIRRIVD